MRYSLVLVMLLGGCCLGLSGKPSHVRKTNKVKASYEEGDFLFGTIVPISSTTALALKHTVDSSHLWVKKLGKYEPWHPAIVVDRFASSKESIYLLQTRRALWSGCELFDIKTAPSSEHLVVVATRRGWFLWEDYLPELGDSGSAVLNEDGVVVALVHAIDRNGRPIVSWLRDSRFSNLND